MLSRTFFYICFALIFMLNASSSIMVDFLSLSLTETEQFFLYCTLSFLIFLCVSAFKLLTYKYLTILLSFYLYLLVWSFAGDMSYGMSKAFLGLVVPLVCVWLLSLRQWTTKELIASIIFTSLLVLVVGIGYKTIFGFYDRSVRFGLFGSITFGWVMSFGALASLFAYRYDRRVGSLALMFGFVVALLWSGSKGPLISFAIVFCLLFVRLFSFYRIVCACLFTIIVVYLAKDYILASRAISTLVSVVSAQENYINESGYGSIGVRWQFYKSSLEMFKNNIFLGVGFGGWGGHTMYTHHYYPHNIFVEILSEAGLLGLFFLILTLGKVLCVSTLFLRSLVFVSVFALLFSGDFSYFRYPLFFILLGVMFKKNYDIKRRRSDAMGNDEFSVREL